MHLEATYQWKTHGKKFTIVSLDDFMYKDAFEDIMDDGYGNYDNNGDFIREV